MKTFILSPNADTLFSDDLKSKLQATNSEILITKEIKPFDQVEGLMEGDEERILAIDPDFCDWNVPNEALDKIPNLKAVCLQTTSFSWIDIDHLKSKGIPVMNLRGFSTTAVAEWAVMMAMLVAKKVPLVIKAGWKQDYTLHQGVELKGQTAGIVGLGSIGKAIAEKCQGLGMNVIYWSKNSRDDRFKSVELAELMATSDFILPATAKNEDTKGLITDEMLRSMKSNAIFVSIVHEVYNHELLLELVKDKKIYGYGFEKSNPDFNSYEGNVWAGPELAWCTNGSMTRNGIQWAESIVNATQGNYQTQVNL